MSIINARTLSASGAYLTKRARQLAEKILRFNIPKKIEVLDGYLLMATRYGDNANGLVIDPPGLLAVFFESSPGREGGVTYYGAGTRDSYNSNIEAVDGPYVVGTNQSTAIAQRLWGFGFDPSEQLPPPAQTPWQNSAVPDEDGALIKQAGQLLMTRMVVSPPSAIKLGPAYPLSGAAEAFSDIRNVGLDGVPKPGFAFSSSWINDLTSGYDIARMVDFDVVEGYTGSVYAGFEYQGEAACIAYHERTALIAMPVVKNLTKSLKPGVVHWGHSGVLFMLFDIPTQDGTAASRPTLRWQQVWSPDEHSVSFFHNGPWLVDPDHSPPGIEMEGYWVEFWEDWNTAGNPVPAGGSRPNWTDCMSVVWFNDRFVVRLKTNAYNGVAAPDLTYALAGGAAVMRFDITPAVGGADLDVTEEVYEIWDAPERHPFVDPADTPYTEWVVGELDDALVVTNNPLALVVADNRLFTMTWVIQADRHDVNFPFGGTGLQIANRGSALLRIRTTVVNEDGTESVLPDIDVNFDSIGYGITGPVISDGTDDFAMSPAFSYKARAIESQFFMLSDHELAFITREDWVFVISPDFQNPHLVVVDLNTGTASVRSEIPIRMNLTVTQYVNAHVSCIQQILYDDEGTKVTEGVILATGPDVTSKAYISRDSGFTWEEYVSNITDGQPQRAVYYIGNPLMVGFQPGHLIR